MNPMIQLPEPYPGESLYSIFCRYHVRSGNFSANTYRDLFGGNSKDISSSLVLPDVLLKGHGLLAALEPSAKASLAHMHSAYQLCSVCVGLSQLERYERLLSGLLPVGDKTNPERGHCAALYIPHAGVSLIRAKNRLCFCPECADEERKLYGEPYWHTLHQVGGIEYCPVHRIPLWESEISVQEGQASEFFPAYIYARTGVSKAKDKKRKGLEKQLITLAEDMNWLLCNGRKLGGYYTIKDIYDRSIKEAYLTKGGPRQYGSLTGFARSRIEGLLSNELYLAMDLSPEGWDFHVGPKYSWFDFLPIQHALYMRMLFGGSRAFYECHYKEDSSSP